MRCITAIWPAGPPKLNNAMRSQTQNASRREIPCSGSVLIAWVKEVSATRCLHGARTRPVIRFGLMEPQREQRVVGQNAVTQHLVIIWKVHRQADFTHEGRTVGRNGLGAHKPTSVVG